MLAASISPADRDRWFAGTLMRLVATADDTGGQLTVLEQTARGGFSPPLHVHHREDTALLVLSGRLTVLMGGQEREISDGEFAWLPRDVPHSFRVDSDEAHFLEFATPGGIEGFHVDASDPAPQPTLPPDPTPDVPRMLSSIGPYGAEIIGPPMAAV